MATMTGLQEGVSLGLRIKDSDLGFRVSGLDLGVAIGALRGAESYNRRCLVLPFGNPDRCQTLGVPLTRGHGVPYEEKDRPSSCSHRF